MFCIYWGMLVKNPGLLKPICKPWEQSNDSVLHQTCIQCLLTTWYSRNSIQSNIDSLVDSTLVRYLAAVDP